MHQRGQMRFKTSEMHREDIERDCALREARRWRLTCAVAKMTTQSLTKMQRARGASSDRRMWWMK